MRFTIHPIARNQGLIGEIKPYDMNYIGFDESYFDSC
jgi:hypothetical protein